MRTSKKVLSNVLHTPLADISSLALSALFPFSWKLADSIGVNRGSILRETNFFQRNKFEFRSLLQIIYIS